MTKNSQAIVYAVINAVVVLFAQQLAEGVYPIPEPWVSVLRGVTLLVVAALTALSPFFDWRDATK